MTTFRVTSKNPFQEISLDIRAEDQQIRLVLTPQEAGDLVALLSARVPPPAKPATPDHWAENMSQAVRDWENVLRGHDSVHPNRDACGGVGGCALMNLEYDSREKVMDMLEDQVRNTGFQVRRKEPFEGKQP